MSTHMWDMNGWRKVDCETSEAVLIAHPDRSVGSSLTDLSGEFGEPIVFTEWDSDGSPILRNYRWPQTAGRVCEHWVPEVSA